MADCVEGGAWVGFMLPVQRDKMRALWRKLADGAMCAAMIVYKHV